MEKRAALEKKGRDGATVGVRPLNRSVLCKHPVSESPFRVPPPRFVFLCFPPSPLFNTIVPKKFSTPLVIPSSGTGSNAPSQLSQILADLASRPSAEILDALRGLERKTTTVFTLLKASVYSIVLQQEISEQGDGEGSER